MFLAQLDLSEMQAALPSFLPTGGCLYFFYDPKQEAWGYDPRHEGAWRVLYAAGDQADFRERAAPEGLAAKFVYSEKLVAPHRIEVLPSNESLPEGGIRL